MTPNAPPGNVEQQIKMLIGEQLVQIVALNDALATARKRIEELEAEKEKEKKEKQLGKEDKSIKLKAVPD